MKGMHGMENTTMGSMDHMDHMDTNHHSTGQHTTGHANYFHFSAHATILFAGWTTMTWSEMLGSCVGVAVLAILFEGLKVLREFIDAKAGCPGRNAGCYRVQACSDNSSKSMSTNDSKADIGEISEQRIGMLRPTHWLQTLLHFIQLWISLSLMLVFMTFNVYLCLAVTVGGALGYFFFAWIQRRGPCYRSSTEMCH